MSESRELRVNGAHLSLLSHKCRLCLLKGPVPPENTQGTEEHIVPFISNRSQTCSHVLFLYELILKHPPVTVSLFYVVYTTNKISALC